MAEPVDKLSISLQILMLSLQQWSCFMREKDRWFGNQCVTGMTKKTFLKLNGFGKKLMNNALNQVQRSRSLYLNMISQMDIWNSRNKFKR